MEEFDNETEIYNMYKDGDNDDFISTPETSKTSGNFASYVLACIPSAPSLLLSLPVIFKSRNDNEVILQTNFVDNIEDHTHDNNNSNNEEEHNHNNHEEDHHNNEEHDHNHNNHEEHDHNDHKEEVVNNQYIEDNSHDHNENHEKIVSDINKSI